MENEAADGVEAEAAGLQPIKEVLERVTSETHRRRERAWRRVLREAIGEPDAEPP